MNQDIKPLKDIKTVSDMQDNDDKNKHFIDDDLFQKLLAIRDEIYHATHVNPSPRKLVNLIIKQTDLTAIRDQLIKQYS
jgi:hypothetical protein